MNTCTSSLVIYVRNYLFRNRRNSLQGPQHVASQKMRFSHHFKCARVFACTQRGHRTCELVPSASSRAGTDLYISFFLNHFVCAENSPLFTVLMASVGNSLKSLHTKLAFRSWIQWVRELRLEGVTSGQLPTIAASREEESACPPQFLAAKFLLA